MYNFFVNNNNFIEDKVIIDGDDYKHIVNVLRMSKDQTIQVCNKETGKSYSAFIYNIENDKVVCKIIDEINSTESNKNIALFQGIPKSDKMEYIIQKSTELGVSKIIPVEMKYCIAKINNFEKKLQRWNKISEAAAKQSKRNRIPRIENSISFKELCELVVSYDLVLVAYEKEENVSIKKVLTHNREAERIAIIVGPEGGFDESEIDSLISKGVNCVTLGKRILRTETAPIAMLSMIMYEFEL